VNDFALMAEVFDGKYGGHPKLMPALQAYSRQFNAEARRRTEYDHAAIEAFICERIRVRRLYDH